MANNLKYSNCCRVCLKKTDSQKDIFNQQYDSSDYVELISVISGIVIPEYEEFFPDKICIKCEALLIMSFEFRKTCIDTDDELMRFYGEQWVVKENAKNIKEEICIDEDFNLKLDELTEIKKEEPKTSTHETPTVDIFELETALDTVEGRRIVEYYNQNQILNEANRQELVLIIIRREANKPGNEKSLQISSTRFQHMTKEIISKFPNESEHIYFKPYSKETGLPANGKLFSKYENYKKKYLLGKPKKSGSNSQDHCLDSDDDIVFLKNNIFPWKRVEELWNETFDRRSIEISQTKPTMNEYLEKFPCLKTDHGYKLLQSDFDKKFPDKAEMFKNSCDASFKNIFDYIVEQKKIDPAVEILMKDYAINPNLVTLLILPILFKINYGRKRNGDRTLIKNTKKEICDSFMILVPTMEEYKLKVAELKENCAKKKNTFEPVIIVVGTLDKIISSSIVINDVSYIFSDYLRAVDIAFKSFQALNCCYPTTCQPVWTFVQKYIYNINTPYDKNYLAVNKVIEQLNLKRKI